MTDAMKIPNCVFVYGTLKRGQLRETAWPHAPSSVQAATIQATLYDLGPYPAITKGDDLVRGEVWCFQREHLDDTLRALDAIEGYQQGPIDLYVRRVVECTVANSEQVSAFAYFYASPADLTDQNRIPTGDEGFCSWPA